MRDFWETPSVRFGSIAVIQPLRVRASLNVCSTPGAPPTYSIWFHLGLLHTILDERLDIFENKAMKLLISTFFTLLLIGFAGGLMVSLISKKPSEQRNKVMQSPSSLWE